VVLLLCEKNRSQSHTIEHIEVIDDTALKSLDINKLKGEAKEVDTKTNKWTFYFLEQKEIDFLESVSNNLTIPRLGEFADIEVGITTGSNEFFSVSKSTVEEYDLHDYAYPLVGRSVQVDGAIFTPKDWKNNKNQEVRSYLLNFPKRAELNKKNGALAYMTYGESLGIQNGYKTGIRDEWQIVPSLWISDCLFIRRNNVFPKLILNKAHAYTTDTMHRVKIKNGINPKSFTSSFYNSLSFAFTEIQGRSYGGGVLELMPSEVKKIALPFSDEHAGLLEEIDTHLRNKNNIQEILKITDNFILKKGFGFSSKEIKIANDIWSKLSQRRINRSKR
jgi:adenine-specific DNA-methyltransferase